MGARVPIHPIAFVAAFVLAMWVRNLEMLDAWSVVRPLAVGIGASALLWAIATRLLGDVRRGAFATSACLLLAFQFGGALVLVGRLTGQPDGTPPAGVREALAVATLVVWLGGVALVSRKPTALAMINGFLNVASVCWLCFPLWTAFTRRPATVVPELPAITADALPPGSPHPDVFYIVLDAYGRDDVLHDLYGLDNGAFLASLERKGFHVARGSHANYPQTSLALASALNMTYLDDVARAVGEDASSRRPLEQLIEHSRVREVLARSGYRFVWFSAGVSVDELRTPDVILSSPRFLTEFEHLLLSSSVFPYWWSLARRLPGGDRLPDQFEAHRARVRWVLDALPRQAEADGPVFVLAHLLCPHPPFVFEANGDRPAEIAMGPYGFFNDGITSRRREDYVYGYRKQVEFISRQIDAAVEAILARSRTPPIIVVQGDHGPGSMWNPLDREQTNLRERMSILNAYYFPRRDYDDVPRSITPVNSFRVVLNKYFGTTLPLLEDRSYFATWNTPYRFVDVTGRLP